MAFYMTTDKGESYKNRVRVSSNISRRMYDELAKLAEPGEVRWEARLVRRAIRALLKEQGIELPSEDEELMMVAEPSHKYLSKKEKPK